MILAASPWWNTALALAAALGYAALALGRLRWQAPAQRTLMSATWLLHAAALIAGFSADPPKFGFAPALSVTAWLVLAVYAVETWVYPRLQSTLALAGLGALAVLLAWVFPGSDQHNLPTQWLPVHWALGVASYGVGPVEADRLEHGRRDVDDVVELRADRAGVDFDQTHDVRVLPLDEAGDSGQHAFVAAEVAGGDGFPELIGAVDAVDFGGDSLRGGLGEERGILAPGGDGAVG